MFVGGGDVIAVAAHSVADEFGIDARAAFFRMLVFFENHHAGPFGHDKSIAAFVPGPACAGGLFVAGGQGAGGTESRHAQFAQRGLGAAGDHDFRQVMLNEPGGVADGVGAGGAGGGDGGVRAVQMENDRDVSAGGIGHETGDGERADPAYAAIHAGFCTALQWFRCRRCPCR